MNYHPSMLGDSTDVRYVLLQKGSKTLYVIGLNPSTADDEVPDPTMRRVMVFAERTHAKAVCVGMTKQGHPKHPLYVRLGKFIQL